MTFSSSQIMAQIPSLNISVADTTAASGAVNTPITVFMDNIFDDVAAFNIWIQLDRPDIMVFQTNTDTVYDSTYWICNQLNGVNCIDSTKVDSSAAWDMFYIAENIVEVGSFDTAGCLTSGWKYVETRSISGTGTDINIVGIADFSNGSQVPPIPAGQQGGVLLRVLADVYDISPEEVDRTVNMLIQTDFKDHFSFARPDGSSINWIPFEYLDTTCFECLQWVGNTCLNYQQVPRVLGQPIDTSLCDSMLIVTDTTAILDSANVVVNSGSVTILNFLCGNVDGSPDLMIDISDLVYLVNFMFTSGPDPIPYDAGKVDCNGDIDISDLVYFVDFIFTSGPVPCANCL